MEKIKLARGRPKKPDSEKVDQIHLSLPRPEANWVRENGYSAIILKLVRKEMANRSESDKLWN